MKKINLILILFGSFALCNGMQKSGSTTADEAKVSAAALFLYSSPCGPNRILPQEDKSPTKDSYEKTRPKEQFDH